MNFFQMHPFGDLLTKCNLIEQLHYQSTPVIPELHLYSAYMLHYGEGREEEEAVHNANNPHGHRMSVCVCMRLSI